MCEESKKAARSNVMKVSAADRGLVEKYGTFTCRYTEKETGKEFNLESKTFYDAAMQLDRNLLKL